MLLTLPILLGTMLCLDIGVLVQGAIVIYPINKATLECLTLLHRWRLRELALVHVKFSEHGGGEAELHDADNGDVPQLVRAHPLKLRQASQQPKALVGESCGRADADVVQSLMVFFADGTNLLVAEIQSAGTDHAEAWAERGVFT